MQTQSQIQSLFSGLECRLSAIVNLHAPTPAERENIWTVAVETYYAAIQAGSRAGEMKKIIAGWLWQHMPALGKSESVIFRQVYYKINRMAESGHVADKRSESNKEKRAPKLSPEDRQKLINCAVMECGGMVDFAWQECLRQRALSDEILKRYPMPANRRPRCPKAIRRQVAAEIKALYQHHVRPHYNSNNIAPMRRDWSEVYAQDIYECDDKTLDVYCRIITEENMVQAERKSRCQFLPMIDAKSGKILDFVLIGEANYNSVSIRTLIKKVCLKYGLPKKFQFERGIWKDAQLLGNNAKNKSLLEVENFATRCGVKLCHALPGRARTKTVETVFRLLDRKMYGWPGYIGNDEMHQKFERVEDDSLFTFDELFAKLQEAVESYNDTPSESIVKGGYLTPNQVWADCRRRTAARDIEPVATLTPQFEYLLAAHCKECPMKQNGVTFTLGREHYHFDNRELVDFHRAFLRQRVKVWFDPEFPETAVVTDLKGEECFPVKRVPTAPANAETSGDWLRYSAASQPHRATMRQIRQSYSNIRATYIAPARPVVADAITIDRAQRMGDAKQQAVELSKRTETESFEDENARYEIDRMLRRKELAELEEQTRGNFILQ